MIFQIPHHFPIMEPRDFYITLQSDSNPNFFQRNTITDFRNRFSPPIKLDGEYEVALVECTYVHSDVIAEKDEKICTHNNVVLTASRDYTSIESLIKDLGIRDMSLENGSIVDNFKSPTTSTSYVEEEEEEEEVERARTSNRLVQPVDRLQELKKAEQRRKEFTSYRSYEQSTFSTGRFNHPTVKAHHNRQKIHWEPKFAAIVGYNPENDSYDHAVYSKTGMTEMFVYCDIVHLQRVGGDMVPMIKKMSYTGQDQVPLTREFVHNQYKRVSKNEIDTIRMYIRSESGAPLPLRFGNFSATLHFKPA